MFDVGLSELIVIAVVALVVIGPERLPAVARTVGAMLGRAQRYFNSVKAEVNRELQLEELRRLQQETYDRVMAMETEVKTELAQMEQTIHDAGADAHAALKSATTGEDGPRIQVPDTVEISAPLADSLATADALPSVEAAADETAVPEVDPRQGDLFGLHTSCVEPPKHV